MKEEAKDLIENHPQVFDELDKIIRQYDTIRTIKDCDELKSRKLAIEIVERWISKIFEANYEYTTPEGEESLYKHYADKD
ncbi:MAG: hypothetical protein U9M90_01240 [Patescibacteria group bacterium]|nr:hypothetical protein [Patescibacteria group bacterium]